MWRLWLVGLLLQSRGLVLLLLLPPLDPAAPNGCELAACRDSGGGVDTGSGEEMSISMASAGGLNMLLQLTREGQRRIRSLAASASAHSGHFLSAHRHSYPPYEVVCVLPVCSY